MRRSAAQGALGSTPALLGGGLVLASALAWLGVLRATELSCPPATPCVTVEELAAGAPLPQTLRIYDREGGLLARVGGPRRRSVPMDRIPEELVDAFVAVEDHRFWSHGGVDPVGVIRAGARNLATRELREGASTIPMQLVRTLWAASLRDAGPWRRKLVEAVHGPRLVDELGRERVLNLYLNAIYLGDGVFGVEEASRHYFGTGVADLSLAQMATLVGMTRGPERYDPRDHPGRARVLRDAILEGLAAGGVVDSSEAAEAKREPLRTVRLEPDRTRRPVDRHVIAAVLRRLEEMPEIRERHGLSVYTTLDPSIQDAGRAATEAQLAAIEAGHFGDFAAGAPSSAVLDVGAVALDAGTGEVLAWIGGRDFERSQFDRVEQARRQVASLVKPFLVALAMERGMGILDMVSTDGGAVATREGAWLPADHVRQTRIPLREGLVLSSNRAAARLAMDLGLDRVATFGARVGLGEELATVPSTAIGTFSASLLDVTSAYTVFSNGGVRLRPRLVDRVEGWDGRVLFERPPSRGIRAMGEATAFAVLDALGAVVDRGTGVPVRRDGFVGPAAGKTGTTDGIRDAWFVGMTPRLVAGIWLGFDLPRTIVAGSDAGDLAAPAWSDWMQRLETSSRARVRWSPPLTVERLAYDPGYGDVFRADCPGAGTEPFHHAWVVRHRYETVACPEDGIRRRMERLRITVIPEPLDPLGSVSSAGRSARPGRRPDPTR